MIAHSPRSGCRCVGVGDVDCATIKSVGAGCAVEQPLPCRAVTLVARHAAEGVIYNEPRASAACADAEYGVADSVARALDVDGASAKRGSAVDAAMILVDGIVHAVNGSVEPNPAVKLIVGRVVAAADAVADHRTLVPA